MSAKPLSRGHLAGTRALAQYGTTGDFSGNVTVGGTLSATGDLAVNTNKFTVAASSGNTVVAGTLGVTGATTATGAIAANGGLATGSASNLTCGGGVLWSAVQSPAQLTANQTDYAVGWTNKAMFRLSSDASRNIYSFSGGAAFQFGWFINIGAFDIVFVHDDGSTGTATARFLCPNSVSYTLVKNASIPIWYDSTSARWRLLGGVA